MSYVVAEQRGQKRLMSVLVRDWHFTVVKDRALDIAWASYKDTALSFITPNGIVAPAFFESQGNGFLRSFYAGLLTTCGLSYIGTPCEDEGETLGLHGRLAADSSRRGGVSHRTDRRRH